MLPLNCRYDRRSATASANDGPTTLAGSPSGVGRVPCQGAVLRKKQAQAASRNEKKRLRAYVELLSSFEEARSGGRSGLSPEVAAAASLIKGVGTGMTRGGRHRATARLVLGLWGLILCTGCQRSPVKLYPVQGKVFFRGQPAAGAQVVFQPAGQEAYVGPRPAATVDDQGTFVLRTEPYGEGAPAGEYHVLISWYPPNAREQENPRNRLPAKYCDPTQPLLKATVKEEPTTLPPFQLTP